MGNKRNLIFIVEDKNTNTVDTHTKNDVLQLIKLDSSLKITLKRAGEMLERQRIVETTNYSITKTTKQNYLSIIRK